MDKRSSHYDWFKGNNNKNNKTPKESLKVVWKFSKIFMYFTLFIFSMWGCVQVLTLKNNPGIGKGTELFTDADEISPTVVTTEITQDANKNYSLKTKTDNIWINKIEDKDLLKDIHEVFKNETNRKDLDAANKGGTVTPRIILKDKNLKIIGGNNPKHKYIANDKIGKPIVISTAFSGNIISKYWKEKLEWPTNIKYKPVKNVKYKLFNIKTPTNAPNSHNWFYGIKYANAILRIGGSDFQAWFKKDPSNITNKVEQTKFVNAHNQIVKYIQDIIRVDNKGVYKGGIFGYSSSSFTPMSSWKHAWQMDRGAGPFYGIFVYPISYVANKILQSFPLMHGWESFLTIVLSVVLISLITFALSFKGLLQQTRMQELNAKKAIIDAKYAPYKGNKQMEMRKRQETQDMYKKEGINPLSSFSMMFITMPFFLAMYRITASIQHIKGTVWLDINFAATSWRELLAGQWQYLWIMILAAGLQILSQLYPRLLTRKRDKNRTNVHQQAAMKKNNKTQNIMMIVFAFISIIFNAGLQVYFIVRASWTILQATIMHNVIIQQKKRAVRKARA